MDFRNEKAKKLKQGAIRAMFDRAATMTDVISMGIGEPDMPTPELVCRAGAEALQQGLTHYTPNAGTMQLRRAIAERASVAPVGYDPAQEIIITNGGMGALSPARFSPTSSWLPSRPLPKSTLCWSSRTRCITRCCIPVQSSAPLRSCRA